MGLYGEGLSSFSTRSEDGLDSSEDHRTRRCVDSNMTRVTGDALSSLEERAR